MLFFLIVFIQLHFSGDPYADPYLNRDPYARDPYAPPPPRAAALRPPGPMVADCEIITFSPKQRSVKLQQLFAIIEIYNLIFSY